MTLVEQALLSGFVTGVIAALLALGFTLVLGILGIANFAHGHQIMVGMYLALAAFQLVRLGPFPSAPLVTVLMFFIGLGIYLICIRPLLERPQTSQVAATIGLMLLLENIVNLIFGGTMRTIPSAYADASIAVPGGFLPTGQVVAAVASIVVLAGFYTFLVSTDYGLSMRACASNLRGAKTCGLPTGRIAAVTFGLSFAAAGLAGVLVSSYQPMTPFVGYDFLSVAFAVMVIAGAGDIQGTVISGVIIGLVEALTAVFLNASSSDSVLFAVVIIVLLIKPEGLFVRR